jgi:hypothetical protein
LVQGDGNAQLLGGSGQPQYATHTSAGTRPGTTGSASFQVDWMPPEGGGPVTFYAAGNAANNNNANSGDSIYTTSLTLQPEGQTPSGNMQVLPQLAFGGGWYSAMYFFNSGQSAASFPVRFYSSDGQPVMVGGADNRTVALAPGGTAIVEAPNTGNLTEGWVAAEMPADVHGHGVFRQSVSGRADQEAVVPMSGSTSRSAVLVFDDTGGLRTAVAVANPTTSDLAVTIVARDENGQAIGSPASLNLRARSKSAFVLAERPELSGITGRRGSVEFSVTSGAVAVLGLRFGASAFTSIPAIER